MITFKHRGDFKNTEKFFSKVKSANFKQVLKTYAEIGLSALREATPIDSGLTADSWGYDIRVTRFGYSIQWTNSNVVNNLSIAILIQYGHGTQNGAFISGRDFINPALKPVFDDIANKLWREVTQ